MNESYKPTNKKHEFTLASELTKDQREFLLNLPPNVDPQVVIDAGLGDALTVCYYGTLLPDKVAGSYVDGAVEAMQPVTIEGYDLLVHNRYGAAYGGETFPHIQPSESENPTPVHGYAFKLKDAPKLNDDGSDSGEMLTVPERIKLIDDYEELPSGMYERRIIPVKDENGDEILAMVYVGTKNLPDRTYKLPLADGGHIAHDHPDLETTVFDNLEDPQGKPQEIAVKRDPKGEVVMAITTSKPSPDDFVENGNYTDYLKKSKK